MWQNRGHRLPRHWTGAGQDLAGNSEAIHAEDPGVKKVGGCEVLVLRILYSMPDPAFKLYNYQALEIQTILSPYRYFFSSNEWKFLI